MSALLIECQAEFLQAMLTEPVVVEEKSRRTGFSWTASFGADIVAGQDKSAGGMDVFYMGYNLEMAREFIDYCAEHASVMQTVASEVRESFWRDEDHPEKDTKVFRIDFASGFKVLALPSRPRALRGMQGLVIIDEAAFHDDLEELLKAALALLMWGGRVVIISTHNGDTNPFNILVQDILAGRKPFKLLKTTFDRALDDGLYQKICERKGLEWSQAAQDKWRDEIIAFYGAAADEELFCIPNPSTGAYIPLALIEARTVAGTPVVRWACDGAFALLPEAVRHGEALRFCETELAPLLDALNPKTPHCFGEDFGRSGDLTVVWPLALERSLVRRTPFVLELRNVPFEQQRQILFYVIDRLPRFRAGKMDARGNGQYLAEVAVQRYGARIEAVMLSEPWYRENMPPLKAGFEDGLLTVPRDREIHDDIRSLALVRGVARVPDKRAGDKASKRHGDAAVAIAMAYAASRSAPEEYGYEAVPSPFGGPDRRYAVNSIEAEIEREQMGAGADIYGLGLRGRVW